MKNSSFSDEKDMGPSTEKRFSGRTWIRRRFRRRKDVLILSFFVRADKIRQGFRLTLDKQEVLSENNKESLCNGAR